MNEYPGRAIAWFAVGCYYMCTRQFDSARRYFGKATSLDPKFAPAWIGFGNSFAAQDESDQVGRLVEPKTTAVRRALGVVRLGFWLD